MSQCETCGHRDNIIMVDYGELTSIGHAIMVPACYLEQYDEEVDECICLNYEATA